MRKRSGFPPNLPKPFIHLPPTHPCGATVIPTVRHPLIVYKLYQINIQTAPISSFLNSTNALPCEGFARKSAIILSVRHQTTLKFPLLPDQQHSNIEFLCTLCAYYLKLIHFSSIALRSCYLDIRYCPLPQYLGPP